MAPSHSKAQIADLLSNPAMIDAAIKLLGQNQTQDELRFKHTRHLNDIGFSAAYGRVGTRFFEFVTGISTKTGTQKWQPKSLTNPIADRVFAKYVRNRGVAHAVDYGHAGGEGGATAGREMAVAQRTGIGDDGFDGLDIDPHFLSRHGAHG